jgi:hypothetical protein
MLQFPTFATSARKNIHLQPNSIHFNKPLENTIREKAQAAFREKAALHKKAQVIQNKAPAKKVHPILHYLNVKKEYTRI